MAYNLHFVPDGYPKRCNDIDCLSYTFFESGLMNSLATNAIYRYIFLYKAQDTFLRSPL